MTVDTVSAEHRLADSNRAPESWIRHLESVPTDVTEVTREIVAWELRELIEDSERGA